jgi:cephalosporin hydroxylase
MSLGSVLSEVGLADSAEAIARLRGAVDARGGIPTYIEHRVMDLLCGAAMSAVDTRMLRQYLRRLCGLETRFLTWEQREQHLAAGHFDTELDMRTMTYSQGAGEPYQWRGRACFKTLYELALYPMILAELRPLSVIELGAGVGGSAGWLSDLCTAIDLPSTIHAVDLQADDGGEGRIRTYRRDCIEWVGEMSAERDDFASPVLVIEDFHGDLHGTMAVLDGFLRPGDYLVIEDALPKQRDMAEALRGRPYLIDTRYTDFFGLNCTSAMNGILKRIQPSDP